MPRDVFSINTVGEEKAAKTIHDTGKRANNARPAGSKIRTAYREAEAEVFRRNGGAVAWKALEKSTIAAKKRRGQDNGILRATGALYKSLTAARAAYQVDVRDAHEMRFGSTLPYAYIHEEGKGGRPRRPTQELTRKQEQAISDAIADYIATGDTT